MAGDIEMDVGRPVSDHLDHLRVARRDGNPALIGSQVIAALRGLTDFRLPTSDL